MFVAFLVSADYAGAWSRIEIISMTADSPLNPTPGTPVSNLIINNPIIFGPSQYEDGHGNEPGHVEFEFANGCYGLAFLENASGNVFQTGVTNFGPTAWQWPEEGRSRMYLSFLGKSYMSLYADSFFTFNDLTLNFEGGIESAQILIYQHGAGWDPYYGDGEEWVLLDYNRPEGLEPDSLWTMVPEPSMGTFIFVGLCSIVYARRKSE